MPVQDRGRLAVGLERAGAVVRAGANEQQDDGEQAGEVKEGRLQRVGGRWVVGFGVWWAVEWGGFGW